MPILNSKESNEILEYLKEKLDLPEHIISIELKIGIDLLPEINCKFYAATKEK